MRDSSEGSSGRGSLACPAEEPRRAEGREGPMRLGHSGRADRIGGRTPRGSQGRGVSGWGWPGRGHGWGVCRATAPRAAQPRLQVEAGQVRRRGDETRASDTPRLCWLRTLSVTPTPLGLPLPPTRALGLGSGRRSLGSGASQVRDDDDPVSTLSLRLQNSLESPASWPGPARIWGMDKPLPSPRRPCPRPRPAPLPPQGPGTRPNRTVSPDPAARPGGGPGAAAAPARGGLEMA